MQRAGSPNERQRGRYDTPRQQLHQNYRELERSPSGYTPWWGQNQQGNGSQGQTQDTRSRLRNGRRNNEADDAWEPNFSRVNIDRQSQRDRGRAQNRHSRRDRGRSPSRLRQQNRSRSPDHQDTVRQNGEYQERHELFEASDLDDEVSALVDPFAEQEMLANRKPPPPDGRQLYSSKEYNWGVNGVEPNKAARAIKQYLDVAKGEDFGALAINGDMFYHMKLAGAKRVVRNTSGWHTHAVARVNREIFEGEEYNNLARTIRDKAQPGVVF